MLYLISKNKKLKRTLTLIGNLSKNNYLISKSHKTETNSYTNRDL